MKTISLIAALLFVELVVPGSVARIIPCDEESGDQCIIPDQQPSE
jgi:hypothetical protein